MKLSSLPKPNIIDFPLNVEQRSEMILPNEEGGQVDVDIEVEEDDNFEQQLVVAVDYLRKVQNFLAFVYQNNSQHQWLGEKAENNLQELVEEVEEFLGDYEV